MRLIAMDLDGTLLHTDCSISDYSKEMIEKAAQKGIMIVPTSGRSFRSVKEQLKGIRGIRYCISANGSILTDMHTEEILYNEKIDPDLTYQVYKEAGEIGAFLEMYCDNDAYVEKEQEHLLYETGLDQGYCDNLLATDIKGLSFELLLRRRIMAINKYHVAFVDQEKKRKFAEKFAENEKLMVTFPSSFNLEIFPGGCNKDRGIRLLCQKFNIPRENTIAIGDSNNDISMIEYAHVGIAVDNAIDSLKAKADYVTKSNDEDGPAIVLEKILNQ